MARLGVLTRARLASTGFVPYLRNLSNSMLASCTKPLWGDSVRAYVERIKGVRSSDPALAGNLN